MIIWYILCSLQFYELRNNKQLSISIQYIPTFREFIQIKFFKFKFLKKKWTKTFLFVIYHTNENIFIMLFCCQIFKELKIWISNHCSNIFLEKILHFKFIQWEYYFKSFNACAYTGNFFLEMLFSIYRRKNNVQFIHITLLYE